MFGRVMKLMLRISNETITRTETGGNEEGILKSMKICYNGIILYGAELKAEV